MTRIRSREYMDRRNAKKRAARAAARSGIVVTPPPSPNLTGEELVRQREAAFVRRVAYEEGRKLVEARVVPKRAKIRRAK